MISFAEFKKKSLKDPEIKREYDALEQEFALMHSLIEKRLKAGLTQSALARKSVPSSLQLPA